MIPYETHKRAPDIKIIHFKPPEEVDGNVIIVLQPRKHSTEAESAGCWLLQCSSTRQRRAAITAPMAAAAGPRRRADGAGAGVSPSGYGSAAVLPLSAPDDVKASSCRAPSSLAL